MKRWKRGLTGLAGMVLLVPLGLEAGLEPGAPREEGYRDSEAVTKRWFGEPAGDLRTPGAAEGRWTAEWEVKGYLDELALRREGLEVRKVGESLLGASVWGLFHEAVGVEGEALTVLIQTRVHGNEPASTEGVLELAWELADGELKEVPVNVILIPVLNPEGAREMARRTGTDIDGNRDYVLQNSAIVRTVYRLMKAYDPEVVVDMHEHGSLAWPYDLMAIEPNNPNIPEALRELTAERIIGAIGEAFEEAGLRAGPYRLVDRREGGIRVRESATTFVSEKNAIALGGRVNLLTEGRGIGLGTQHFKRRTVSQYTAARAVLEAAVRHRVEIRRTVAAAREAIIRGAEEWTLRVEPREVPARHAFLDPERLELVEHETTYWDRTNGTVTAAVAVPRAYVVDVGQAALLDRLEGFGLEMEVLTEPRDLEVEKLVVSAFGPGDGRLYGGRLVRPDGTLVRPTVVRNHDITVRTVKETVRVPAGSRIIPTGQPMGLYLITLEPAAYSSFAALSFWGESLPEGFEFPVYRLR